MTTSEQELTMNAARFWETIMASARRGPGRTPTGLQRLALSDADREMRDLFVTWCRQAGCGVSVDRIGYAGPGAVGGRPLDAYFELHIEQGPILDDKGIPVGVVTGSYEVRGMNIVARGETAHSGPTPMAHRRNALVGAAMLIVAVNEIGWAYAPEGKSTCSRIEVWPNLAGILPDFAQVTVDVRHPEVAQVERMLADIQQAMRDCAQRAQVEMEIIENWQFGSERFDPSLVSLVRSTAQRLGAASLDVPSQAGHDAYYISRVAATAMIFAPCERGISHHGAENMTLDEAEPGVNVLLHCVLARANR